MNLAKVLALKTSTNSITFSGTNAWCKKYTFRTLRKFVYEMHFPSCLFIGFDDQ